MRENVSIYRQIRKNSSAKGKEGFTAPRYLNSSGLCIHLISSRFCKMCARVMCWDGILSLKILSKQNMSRRAKADVKANVADKFARLKELRKNKETNLQDYQASQITARKGLLTMT